MKQERISLFLGFRWKRLLAILLLIVYLLAGQLMLSSLVVDHAEDQCIDRLQDVTLQYAENYYHSAMTDREQLHVVASLLSIHITQGKEDLSSHLATFESRGMIDWLQVLLPDGTLITSGGALNIADKASYAEEAAALPYISNISPGFLDPAKRVIRSAVPVTHHGETIAVLYGVYDLSAGRSIDSIEAFDGQSYTYIMETDTGNFIFDSLNGRDVFGPGATTYQPKANSDFSHTRDDVLNCREGYAAFYSYTVADYMYVYYTPIGINKWMAMVSVPEQVALSHAHATQQMMLSFIVYSALGVACYILWWVHSDRKLRSKNDFVDHVQSRLMEVYRKPEYFHQTLLELSQRAKSDAVFILDEQLALPEPIVGRNDSLVIAYGQDEVEIAQELLLLCRQLRKGQTLRLNNHLLRHLPHLAQLMTSHAQQSLTVLPITAPDGTIHQLMGAFSPANPDTLVLLSSVAVDVLMAANNIDYLTRLEKASTVDVLTGALNRTSYHMRLDQLQRTPPKGFACVYIDANDLHAINNRFGHDKGDAMLRAVSAALQDAFGRKNVYRFGGDEFVILVENCTRDWLDSMIAKADSAIHAQDYTVSIGADWEEAPQAIDPMIRVAERHMYKAKYQFYQEKQQQAAATLPGTKSVRRLLTENADVDAFLHVAQQHYHGVCFVNLRTDEVREVLTHPNFASAMQHAPAPFTQAFQQYIAEVVNKDSRRNVQNFFDYDRIAEQLASGATPLVEFTRVDGQRVRLTIYASPRFTPATPESIWVFEPA